MMGKLAVDYEKLGKRISWFRNKANYSQENLCEKLDISRETLARIETSVRTPSLETLVNIANTLGISADDLLVDSLTHSVSTADSEIHQMLVECNKTEEEILTEMVKALKAILYRSGI